MRARVLPAITMLLFSLPAATALAQTAPSSFRDEFLERAVLMCTGTTISRADLGLQPPSEQRIEDLSIEEVEALLIGKALTRFGGNVSKAAEALGLSRGALYRRMQRYNL